MRTRCVLALAAGLAVVAFLAADAAAMYHPTVGRFMQRDPRGVADGPHAYMYVGGRPLRAVDPTGEAGVSWKEPTRPDSVAPTWVDQGEMDSLDPESPKGSRRGWTGYQLDRPRISYGYALRGPGSQCCDCWFRDVIVTISYKELLSKDLRAEGSEGLKSEIEAHEQGHLAQDFSATFNDPEMQRGLEEEVAKHDTPEEAYRLDAATEDACKEKCFEHLAGIVSSGLMTMRCTMDSRAIARDNEQERGRRSERP